jgi:hypothetical protein
LIENCADPSSDNKWRKDKSKNDGLLNAVTINTQKAGRHVPYAHSKRKMDVLSPITGWILGTERSDL